jgi:hypothetical protein
LQKLERQELHQWGKVMGLAAAQLGGTAERKEQFLLKIVDINL